MLSCLKIARVEFQFSTSTRWLTGLWDGRGCPQQTLTFGAGHCLVHFEDRYKHRNRFALWPETVKQLSKACEMVVFRLWTLGSAGLWSVREGKQMGVIVDVPHFCLDWVSSLQCREGDQLEPDGHSELRILSWRSKEVKLPGIHRRERERAVHRETSGNHRASSLISCVLMSTYMWRNDLTPGKELPKGTEGNIFRDHTDLGTVCIPNSYRKQQRHPPPPITS